MANVRDQFCDLLKSKPKPPVLLSYDYEKQSAQRRHLVRSSSATAKHCGQVQAVDEEAGADEHQQCSSLSSAAVLTDVDNVTEVEELHGTVVRGRNGQFYVALNSEMNLDNRDDDKIDLEHFGNVFVTVSATDGAQTLVFDDTDRWAIDSGRNGQRLTITGHANSAAVAQCHGMRRTMAQKSVVRSSQQSDDHHYSGDAFTGANADNSANTNDDRGGNEQPKQQHLVPSHSSSATAFDEDVAQEEVIEYEDTAGSYDFKRRSRVFGGCRCFECGQTFVNMARLERHLSVHQQYGLYLCPLCNKTYKYEYNLFFHWRNTCRDMNELLSSEERKSIEINALRQLVEEIAQKKMAIGPLELAVPSVPLRRALPPILRQNAVPPVPQQQHKTVADKTLASKLTMANMFGDKLALCSLCGLTVYNKHLLVHLAVHRGERPVDGRSIGGAFFCNLCGLAFRSRANLIRHWRTGCSTIHANLPTNSDIALDDIGLKQLVVALLKNLTTCKDESEAFGENFEDGVEQPSTSNQHHNFNDYTAKAQHRAESVFESPSQLDEQWAQAEGILFADDFFDDDIPGVVADANNICGSDGTLLLFNSDGRLGEQYKEGAHHYQHQRSRFGFAPHPPPPPALVEQRQRTVPAALVAAVLPSQQHGTQAVRATSAERDGLQWIQYAPQSVQCSECYRSFSSVQRLEKHMASTHCSFGTHHCLLCGSRFKYEYNLLFHYRQVCPYTLKMIDKKMRQQMEATDLKKSVRRIAAATTLSHLPSAGLPHHHGTSALLTQSSASMALSVPTSSSHSTGNNSSSIGRSSSAAMQQLNSSSSTLSNLALLGSTIHDDIAHNGNGRPSTFSLSFAVPCADADEEELESVTSSSSVSASHASVMVSSSRPELGDSVIRRQMMKKIIQKHRRHQQLDSSSANFAPLPHQLLQPTVRPNLPDGTQCPICSIVFYGLKVLVRHLRAAHPNESSVWERTLSALGASTSDGVNNGNLVPILLPASSSSAPATKLFPSRLSTQRKRKIFREDSEEHPPQLELAEHVDSSLQHLDNQDPSSHHIK